MLGSPFEIWVTLSREEKEADLSLMVWMKDMLIGTRMRGWLKGTALMMRFLEDCHNLARDGQGKDGGGWEGSQGVRGGVGGTGIIVFITASVCIVGCGRRSYHFIFN